MNRLHQTLLIGSTIVACWLGMQAVHEFGHVLGAWTTDGRVSRVVLHPLTISRTDLAENPKPQIVAWAGPIIGVLAPLATWALAAGLRIPGRFVLRFFAGFCLLANGLYIGVGSFFRIGDCGDMLRAGTSIWHLWLFGIATAPIGLWLWHRQGKHFGLGTSRGSVSRSITYTMMLVAITLIAANWLVQSTAHR